MLAFKPTQLPIDWRDTLFASVHEHLAITDGNLYCPHHERFFNMTDSERNNTTVAPRHHVIRFVNDHTADVSDGGTVPVHVKLCPLVDPLDYLVGSSDAVAQRLALPMLTAPSVDAPIPNTPEAARANSPHNRAYTDAFFIYLSSRLLHNAGIQNALDYYGVFTGIKHRYRHNIADDLDELWESDSFLAGLNDRFELDADQLKEAFLALRDRSPASDEKPLLALNSKTNPTPTSLIEIIDIPMSNPKNTHTNTTLPPLAPLSDTPPTATEPYDFTDYNAVDALNMMDEDSDGDSNRTSITTVDCNTLKLRDRDVVSRSPGHGHSASHDSESESESESEGSEIANTIDGAWCTIPALAVTAIVQERLEGTLQDLIDEGKLSEAEWRSCLFQITATLHAYNTAYDMVHNDLHTSNVMWTTTTAANLVYRHRGSIYKVPTYGRLFKIIDFGRATYRFGGLSFLNDCYEEGHDASNQYNYDRLMNPNEPLCAPHPAFDLCRLACGLYDYFDSEGEYPESGPSSGAAAMIDKWCQDDAGRNMLYKQSGSERYPGFKLYRMIARKVTRHVPGDVLTDPWFHTFMVHPKRAKKLNANVNDLDAVKAEFRVQSA
jgi:hypothetical protein